MKEIIDLLYKGNYSCVIQNGKILTFNQRGVMDLYNLLNNKPDFLENAYVADKVIGKGAAALLALGKVKEVYTDLISEPGLILLEEAGIETSYHEIVPFIRNREKNGWCPLEKSCKEAKSAKEIYPLIEMFIEKIRRGNY